MKFGRVLMSVCVLACLSTAIAFARPDVRLHLTAFLLDRSGGHVTAVPLDGKPLQAGDRVRFVIEAANQGSSAVLKLMPKDMIPPHMTYVPGSANAANATPEFTLDGKTWSAHPTVSVKTPKGVVKRPADPALYKGVRWVTGSALAAHHSQTFTFEAQVNGQKAGAK